jgi:hypothetical protein
MSEIPTPNADACTITGLVKEASQVTGYQLSDGRIVSKEEGINLARQGCIRDVGISTNMGTEYLKSLPDNDESNNLNNLPTVSQ